MAEEGESSHHFSQNEGVEDLLGRLELHEDEEEDSFVCGEEAARPDIQAKWLAILKVHTVKGSVYRRRTRI